MDSQVVAALIGAVGTIVGGIVVVALPNMRWFQLATSTHGRHSLLGKWDSRWGPMPNGPLQRSERLVVTKHRGTHIAGHISMHSEPHHKWLFEGRYDGRFLQILYFPSPESDDKDFLSHGCYFFERSAQGQFVGYSMGFGQLDDEQGRQAMDVDYHEMRRATV